MKPSILKPIIAGILLGAFVFFTGPLLLVILALKFIFTPFGWGRMMLAQHHMRRFGGPGGSPIAWAEKLRGMSDVEFAEFKSRFQQPATCACHR